MSTTTRLSLPVLPKKGKNYTVRLADALGQIKLAKDSLIEQYNDLRDKAMATGELSLRGTRFEISLSPVESMRLDQEKLEAFLRAKGHTMEEFQTKSESVRLTVKPII